MNYFEMSSKFICSVVMPLALMFAACSTDDKPIAGGSAEETGVYADIKDITLRAAAYRVLANSDPLQDSAFTIEGFRPGSIAWLYELDSTSFAETGVSYSDTLRQDGDNFSFKNVALESPYVLVRVLGRNDDDSWDNLVAIADVRKTKKVTLNLLTTFKTALWRYLAKEGVAHDSLDLLSESAALEALGITDGFNGFESGEILENEKYIMTEAAVSTMFYRLGETEWNSVDSVKSVLERNGSLDELDSATRMRFMSRLSKELSWKWWISRMNHDVLDSSELEEEVLSVYKEEFAYSKVLAGVYMRVAGEGFCTKSREGDAVKLADTSMYLVCRSEGWRIEMGEAGKVHPENGTMTDSRDGRTYRTVTYNIDGKMQTWMAENLKYEYGKSRCLDDKDRRCEVYGRLYTWRDALALDSSIVWTKEECEEYYRPGFEEYEACVAKYQDWPNVDSATLDYRCGSPWDLSATCEEATVDERKAKYKYQMAMEMIDSVNHQGVCPDGWHVATADDWNGLYKYVGDAFNVGKKEVVMYLLQSEYTDGPVGFGLRLLPTWEGHHTSLQIEWEQAGNRFLNVYAPIYAVPFYKEDWADGDLETPEDYDSKYEPPYGYDNRWFVDVTGYGILDGWARYETMYIRSGFDYEWLFMNMPVRCVKN